MTPSLHLLIPDNHRLGGKADQVHAAIFNGIRLLLGCHVNFGVINEHDLERLPAAAKAIVYPVPYCPSDATFERLAGFVRAGGSLYFSGDIAYDELRQRTRPQRFKQLGLPEQPAREPMTLAGGAQGSQPVSAQLGRGKVFFVPGPVEIRASADDLGLYRRFLEVAGVRRIGLTPDDPKVHAFSIPTVQGGTVYVLFNTDATVSRTMKLTDLPAPIELSLAPLKPGLAWVDKTGRLLAAETGGGVRVAGKPIVSANGQIMVAALDGQDLAASRQLMLLPIEAGEVSLHGTAAWQDPVIAAGEFERGQWHPLEQWRPSREAEGLKCEVSGDRALNILIIAEAGQVDQAVSRLISTGRTPRAGH